MSLPEIVSFEYEGKKYEIRFREEGSTIIVRAFDVKTNKPAGYEYSVSGDVKWDLVEEGYDPVNELISFVRSEVEKKRWEK